MSGYDQTANSYEEAQGSKSAPRTESTGTICLQLGSAVFLFLLHSIPLCSSNDFHIKLPGSSSRFQYNKKKAFLFFFFLLIIVYVKFFQRLKLCPQFSCCKFPFFFFFFLFLFFIHAVSRSFKVDITAN